MSQPGSNGTKSNIGTDFGLSPRQIMYGALGGLALAVIGVVTLVVVGGPDSSTAISSLMVLMTTVVGGFMTAFISKVNSMHRQFDGLQTDLIASKEETASTTATLKAQIEEMKRAAATAVVTQDRQDAIAVETAVITAEVARTNQDAAEHRPAPSVGSTAPVDVNVVNSPEQPVPASIVDPTVPT